MRLDILGLGLIAAAIAWTYVSAASSGGRADDVVAAFAACAGAFVAGRALGYAARWIVPLAVGLAALYLLWKMPGASLSSESDRGLFGYSNARASFFLQASAAGFMLAAALKWWPGRVLAIAVACGFAAVPWVNKSVLAGSLAVLFPLFYLAGSTKTKARAAIYVLGLGWALVLVGTTALGVFEANLDEFAVGREVDAALSARRPALWHEAIGMMSREPLIGVGPNRFRYESEIARADTDVTAAHHGFLQQGAEGGAPALILVVGIFGWVFVRLGSTRRPDRVTVLGAAAIAVLGIHASIDYVFHFLWIPVIAAALAGSSCSRSRQGEDIDVA